MVQRSKPSIQATKVVSFRVSHEYFAQLKDYARNLRDDAGLPLNVNTTARRLVVNFLTKPTTDPKDKSRKTDS